nr:structural maintenance of chromosomes protein 1 [Ipomoea trifida]
MPSQPSPGKIHRLELENFKSYKGFQTIGPFYDFTAIIGPNGAGKSNLMDAISFVLGVRTGQLRGAQLRDLIYAFDDREKEQRGRKAFVRMVYQLASGTEIQFTRSITSAGSSEYLIDGRVVNWDEYTAKLKSLDILVKSRNFLVFQGDVESIASKNPRELTALLEQISGSEEFKRRYDELEEEKARAEEKKALAYQRKKTVNMERKQKKEQKEEAEKHLRLQRELKNLKQEHFLWQLFNIENDITKGSTDLEAEEIRIREIADELEKYENEAREKKKELSGYMRELALYERKIADKKSKLDKSQPEVVKKKEEASRINSKIKSTSKELEKRQGEKKKHAAEVQKLERDLLDITEQLNELRKKSHDAGGKLQLADSQLETYHEM